MLLLYHIFAGKSKKQEATVVYLVGKPLNVPELKVTTHYIYYPLSTLINLMDLRNQKVSIFGNFPSGKLIRIA